MSAKPAQSNTHADLVKRRVTGAIVLVGAAVILLSILLRGDGQPLVDDSGGPQLVLIGAEPTKAQQARADAQSDRPVADTRARADSPNAASQVAEPALAQTRRPEPQAAQSPAVVPAQSTPAPPRPTSQANTPRDTDDSGAPTGWFVQVGMFGSRSNADGLAKTLTDRTYTARVDVVEVNGKRLHRVMVGPYPSEAQAKRRQPWLARAINESGRVIEFPG